MDKFLTNKSLIPQDSFSKDVLISKRYVRRGNSFSKDICIDLNNLPRILSYMKSFHLIILMVTKK